MRVIFVHGPAAAGKYTVGRRVAELLGLPLFHNHLTVDLAKSLFAFDTEPFSRLRAAVWRAAFAEAAAAGRSFVFTFHPEATVDRGLIDELVGAVSARGGAVDFVELRCGRSEILRRIGNADRSRFGKLTDVDLYQKIEREGGFAFPALPAPVVVVDTDRMDPQQAASTIVEALRP